MSSSRTMLRWCHSGVNVADGRTKVATNSLELPRHVVRADTWQLVFDPECTSYRRLKGAAKKVEAEDE
eukprot:9610737-Prorocentrum_lima.AAC.1